MKVSIIPIGPKKSSLKAEAYKRAVENAGNMSSMAVQVDFKVTTRTWKTQPDFPIKHSSGVAEWEISTDNAIYGYVSGGTAAHVIVPKVAKRLVFYRTGFSPKSRIGWIGSNKGARASSNLTFAKKVMHPGIKGREFEKAIKEKWDVEWPRQLQRAVRAVAQFGG